MPPYGQPIPIARFMGELALAYLGPAAAGFPSPAADWREDAINLVEWLNLDRAATFVFRVSGSSMVDAGLFDGDVLVVDRDTRPASGMIVVAVVDGGFVVRQLVTRAGVPLLEARNARASYAAVPCDESVDVFGVVRASVRQHTRHGRQGV